jgi:hypothetical protein
MRGVVRNMLDNPSRVDKATGEIRPAYKQVQLEVVEPLQNGQERLDIKTLSVDDLAPYAALKGSEALVEVGVYAKGTAVAFYAKKGVKPISVRAATARSEGAAAPKTGAGLS